jgi:hypothetical protein
MQDPKQDPASNRKIGYGSGSYKKSFRIHNTDGDGGMLLTGLPMVWKGGGTPLAGGGRGGGPPIVTIVLVVSKMLKKLPYML